MTEALLKDWQKLSLDELAEKVGALPKEARDELVRQAYEFTAGMKWIPNSGPQSEAFFSDADILLYGGQAAGGKSDLLLGLALTAHRRSLIIRQQYNDLDALTERAIKINGSRAGFNGSNPPSLRTSDGRFIQFSGARTDQWQGHGFDLKCVGRGTRVWMADGSRRPIEDIRVGNMVQTIEGPRRVTKVFPVRRKPAVQVVLRDSCGQTVGVQLQSLNHELLTGDGWASHDKICGSRRFSTSSPKKYYFCELFFQRLVRSCRVFLRHQESQASNLWQVREPPRLPLDRLYSLETCVSDELFRQEIYSEASGCGCQGTPQFPSRFSLQGPRAPVPALSWLLSSLENIDANDGCDEHFSSLPQYYQGDCLFDNHQCDARVPRNDGPFLVVEGGLFCLPLQADAELPIPNNSGAGGRGKTHKHTLHKHRYDHPYRMEKRQAVAGLGMCSFSFYPAGEADLFDIEVDDINSFITDGGFINKNCFDEATQIQEEVIRFHLGWLRSTEEGQRTRAILASNPPINATGDWVINMFAPWLDLTHPNPAKHGELRWFVKTPDGIDMEVDGPQPHQFPGEERPVMPMSRTFIPAKLTDNPYLVHTDYQSRLDSMEEPYRSAMRDGNFMASRRDQEHQVIPVEWVVAAQKRWEPGVPRDMTMTAIGVDVGAGGKDRVVLAPRYGEWFAPLIAVAGKDAPDGSAQAALITKHRRDSCAVVVDVGGGYGGDCVGRLKDNGVTPIKFNGSEGSSARTKDGSGRIFVNKRAEAYWRFREALNPDQPGGPIIALPDDAELRSELTAVTFIPDILKVQIESKVDVKKRLGRSPDRADAVVMAFAPGDIGARRMKIYGSSGVNERPTRANLGYGDLKKW